ncbi:hypothetical protein GIB67_029981 [Kingdonia uniflora]|uniref:glucose-1-phosphate adenylyltransferase n=1 Tax=Kingdonia uniflora TaxID=39325 RepID=A0A7J7MXV5_9MAGN|nr:hypothetical protein GIB67_029981 [Kingdonia uniflora]
MIILTTCAGAKHRHIENILILSGDHLYRMDYMDFVQHINSGADIYVSCLPMDGSRASDFGLMKIDKSGRICQFLEKPKGEDLKSMDTIMMGSDYYQTEAEIASILGEGKVPMGVGSKTKISNCIIAKNAKIGKNVIIANRDKVEEAERPSEGFYIRSGITVVLKNSTIPDGTII